MPSLDRLTVRMTSLVAARDEGGAHDARSAAAVGSWLGGALGVAFVTGLISHLHQHPVSWFDLPSRPVWGYQLTQGLHVAAGIACVPLLIAKLWVVYGRLFVWPPVRDLGHALERLLIAPLVAGMIFQLVSGLLNVVRWYPWPFFFPRVHYAVAWIVIGALLAHLAFKAPLIRRGAAASAADDDTPAEEVEPDSGAADADRRALLIGTGAAVTAVTVATVGQTVPLLRAVSVLAPRDPYRGPQGLTVNRTAQQAGIRSAAMDPNWALTVGGPTPRSFTLSQLLALPRATARLPLACVEGWSYSADWTGVPLRALLEAAGVPGDQHLRAVSLERNWLYAQSPLNPGQAWDPLTILAFAVDGEPLDLDHGFPLRLIAPNRPGVQQTKWLGGIEPA